MSKNYEQTSDSAVKYGDLNLLDWMSQRLKALKSHNQNGKTDFRVVLGAAAVGGLLLAWGLPHATSGGAKEGNLPVAAASPHPSPTVKAAHQKLTVQQIHDLRATPGIQVEVVGLKDRDLGTLVVKKAGSLVVVQIFDNPDCSFKPNGHPFIEAEVAPGAFGSGVGAKAEWEDIQLQEGPDGQWHVTSSKPSLNDPMWGGTHCLDENPS